MREYFILSRDQWTPEGWEGEKMFLESEEKLNAAFDKICRYHQARNKGTSYTPPLSVVGDEENTLKTWTREYFDPPVYVRMQIGSGPKFDAKYGEKDEKK